MLVWPLHPLPLLNPTSSSPLLPSPSHPLSLLPPPSPSLLPSPPSPEDAPYDPLAALMAPPNRSASYASFSSPSPGHGQGQGSGAGPPTLGSPFPSYGNISLMSGPPSNTSVGLKAWNPTSPSVSNSSSVKSFTSSFPIPQAPLSDSGPGTNSHPHSPATPERECYQTG